ncbi:MAG: CAP domain-containing protein [Clostridia bacterium]|nr:CAP domain-containing protein [Clostridia bacterium]
MKPNTMGKAVLSVFLTLFFALSLALPAFASDSTDWKPGWQTDAKETLTLVNEIRVNPKTAQYLELNWTVTEPKLDPLRWDNDLAHIAAVRAEELSRNYGHMRPNGQWQWSCTYNGKEMYQELICREKETAKEAVDYWYAAKSETYNGQENRRMLLEDRVTRMGAGHYISERGEDYWVIAFGR